MADIKRTCVYAEADGVILEEDGSIKDTTVTTTGNFKSLENAERAIRRHFPDFLPKDVRVKSCTFVMDENMFFDDARSEEVKQLLPVPAESKKK